MKNKLNGELSVCGFEAVKAIEREHPQMINRLYFNKARQYDFAKLCAFLAKFKKPYNLVEDADLERLSQSVHHQGVVATIDIPKLPALNKDITRYWVQTKSSTVLLDNVLNANNVGAVVRNAAYFGIQNIVLPRQVARNLITTSSYRTAQGGMEYVNIYTASDLVALINDVKRDIVCVASTLQANTSVQKLPELIKDRPYIVVLGNEETGIRGELLDAIDYHVTIKGAGSVQSLNVAQASSVLFYLCALSQNYS